MKRSITIKRELKNNWLIILLYVIMLGLYILDVLYMWQDGINLHNSDSAAELILADKLNKEGGLLSRTWYYSTELRVLSMQIIYKIGLFFFPDNWHAARVLSVALFLLIMILTAHYFAKAIRYPIAAPLLSIILIAPYSNWYGWNVVFNSHYVINICIMLTAVSLFLRTLQAQKKGHRILCIVLSFALAFTASLNGIRLLMICYGPLLLTAFVYAYYLHVKRRRGGQNQDRHALKIFGYGVVLCGVALCGYLVNQNILSKYYVFESYPDLAWRDFDLNRFLNCLGDLIALFGWHQGSKVLSAAGIGSALAVVLAIILTVCTIYCLKKDELDEPEMLALLFSVCCFAVLMLVYGLSERYNDSYWTLFLPDAFIGMILFSKHWKPNLERVGVIFFTVVVLLINSHTTMTDPYIDTVPNDLAIQDVVAWLKDNGYTQGVAEFWNSDIVTALSDGKIEMWTVNSLNDMTTYDWLQDASHDELPEGKVFVLRAMPDLENIDESLNTVLTQTLNHLVYQDGNYLIYEFDDIQEYCDIVWSVYGKPESESE